MNSSILLMNGYLSYFPYFRILNNAAVNAPVHVSWGTCAHLPLEYIPRNGIAGSKVIHIVKFNG